MTRVAVFVDVQNLYYTARQTFQSNVDYNALWARVTGGRQVVAAHAYAVDRGDEKQRQFQNILRAIGFNVKLKPFVQRADGSAKGDWDVGITIDILEQAADADVIVLASGDGDFAILAEHIRAKHGCRVEVYGVQALTAAALARAADQFVPIEGGLLLK
ncbi:LabA-like NYN domain-containing protein [Alloalcanivorax mobilis]|uniref:LabA-like NYN domain-containing protein n=1 Tax=Alloalcanivorax mobilis TaxID=2019569 RepID=UPI000C7709E9|nr:NYN domain-containing protein [Alloalcanivorax mobilis]